MTNQEFIESITLQGEEWKEVVGFEGLYMVSSFGRVASLERYVNNRFKDVYKSPKLLKPHIWERAKGSISTPSVILSINDKDRKFHIPMLVATHFIANPDNRTFLRFKDGNNQNCKASNLEWGVLKDRRKQYDTSSFQGEEWADIPGYEGRYRASTYGRIYSSRSRKILTPFYIGKFNKGNRYLGVTLVDKDGNKEKHFVHRIVAMCFIPNPNNYPCIDHINTLKHDNKVENLRWCTYSQNNMNPITYNRMKNASRIHIINSKKIVQIKDGKLIKEYDSMQQAKRAGYSYYSISKCCKKEQASHRGYQWMFKSDYENFINKSKNFLSNS